MKTRQYPAATSAPAVQLRLDKKHGPVQAALDTIVIAGVLIFLDIFDGWAAR